MKKFIFKGKSIDNDEWFYGSYLYDPRPNGGHFIIWYDGYKEMVFEVYEDSIEQIK